MPRPHKQNVNSQFGIQFAVYSSCVAAMLLLTITQHTPVSPQSVEHSPAQQASLILAILFGTESSDVPDSFEKRIAQRLQKRLTTMGMSAPSVQTLAKAVEQRQQLLHAHARVSVKRWDDTEVLQWDVSTQRYPLWIQPQFSSQNATFILDKDAIAEAVDDEVGPMITPPEDISVHAIVHTEKVLRADVSGIAKAGDVLDAQKFAGQIHTVLTSGMQDLTLVVPHVNGKVTNLSGIDLGELTLIATGKSNFKGSTPSRSFNVKKALNEHVTNALVAPGEKFSFNSTLHGPVSVRNGWMMAKVIVNGADLEMQPGGGICQASTTLYRAILNAGFPVTERKSHSLYVTYYKEYGVGIDATVYPGSQDLVFMNDSPSYVLIQAYNDGYDAYVNMYGTPDGRSVALTGPYFTTNAPESLHIDGRGIKKNEIAWQQRVTYADGRTVDNTIVSRYKELPKSLRFAYSTEVAGN